MRDSRDVDLLTWQLSQGLIQEGKWFRAQVMGTSLSEMTLERGGLNTCVTRLLRLLHKMIMMMMVVMIMAMLRRVLKMRCTWRRWQGSNQGRQHVLAMMMMMMTRLDQAMMTTWLRNAEVSHDRLRPTVVSPLTGTNCSATPGRNTRSSTTKRSSRDAARYKTSRPTREDTEGSRLVSNQTYPKVGGSKTRKWERQGFDMPLQLWFLWKCLVSSIPSVPFHLPVLRAEVQSCSRQLMCAHASACGYSHEHTYVHITNHTAA
mmetsp:Transcript_15662/g.18868  ORF Transcript_15662/g.18868 Transcript_15662/m.18868 type:complete len:261 (+) Transcript_15662:828-1610(+)